MNIFMFREGRARAAGARAQSFIVQWGRAALEGRGVSAPAAVRRRDRGCVRPVEPGFCNNGVG